MEVIPAIDILAGNCVRLYQGDYEQAQVYNSDPVAVAQEWIKKGATRLHLVDLDGAKQGKPVNLDVIKAIVTGVDVPVQVGGGLRTLESLKQLFNLGVAGAIAGTVAVENPEEVKQWCVQFPGRVIIGIDAREGKVATRGWLETTEVEAIALAQQFTDMAAAIIYTDIQRDGTLSGPNLKALRELAVAVDLPIIASGGVSSLTDLLSLLGLESLGVTGVILGRALYTGAVDLTEAIKAIGPGRLQDVPLGDNFSTFA
ncbi:1-(5-phosphoribosyl)-5-[(5-phosphoribosylamino)methylideneamino]imidazole-4-carboxamide isomerase [Gloeocapsa sp. PCC 73106]|uniref:1-(5-phosphoribosyl)-5-[(5- phosphoribosylamino)methylideneamino]imidazole-4- carboxamide isomerase n=1 Tax=Gloeocapsa sp. PCC 73106 TaxID=102232 RepID=UPI0002ABEB18|nr:1-(5-phosphoribosyl)-5-[(5-phosphoribosylamino)methylideneamino]imidazole-4-carboxamide isomerase [Gloeocapsa sp. PCC 73106]ELR99212.1 1-(5-phosphoribosyl)-5-((5-phosphoribosylamino)methylideneamino) imidazole-4-carboxamide isomerase [Gloeocapsa sp. PCC 73106]